MIGWLGVARATVTARVQSSLSPRNFPGIGPIRRRLKRLLRRSMPRLAAGQECAVLVPGVADRGFREPSEWR